MEELDEDYDGLLLLEPRDLYDACIVGIGRRFHDTYVVYDEGCIIDAIAADLPEPEAGEDDLRYDEAREHFEFNVIGGWVGETTPGFLERKENR